MAENPNSYVCTLDDAQIAELKDVLEVRGFEFGKIPYAKFQAKGPQLNISVYESGKTVVQGRGTGEFVTFTLEPQILNSFGFGYGRSEDSEVEKTFTAHGGVDESGKGDFFGPLVIAAVYVDAESRPKLVQAGVQDSKNIKNDRNILAIAAKIKAICPKERSLVKIGNEAYNRLYDKIGNLNRLLAWGHAKAIEELLTKVPACERVLSDKFGHESLIRNALMQRGRKILLEQQTKAESDVAVAAASILAREAFIVEMKKLSDHFEFKLPRGGANAAIESAGRAIIAAHGVEALGKCAKLHFKTMQNLFDGSGL